MKIYIIEDTMGQWDNLFLVKANNKKEALDILWVQMGYDNQERESVSGYRPHYKKDFQVTEISMNENDNFIILH